MKKLQILICLISLIIACKSKNQEVIIKGIVLEKDIHTLLYSPVLNHVSNTWFMDSVKVNAQGKFVITAKIDQPCFMSLLYDNSVKRMIIEPGCSYELEVNGTLGQIDLISGGSKVQEFYDNLSHFSPVACDFFNGDLSDHHAICNDLKAKMNDEISGLDNIKCNQKVRDLIKADREVYYNLSKATLASRNNVMMLRTKDKVPNDIMDLWGEAVSDSIILRGINKNADYFYKLLDLKLWYLIFTKVGYDDEFKKLRKEKRQQGLTHTHNIELAKDLLSGKNIEYFTATYIQSCARQDKFEKELIGLYEDFKIDFPNSPYSGYIEPNIRHIISFYEKVDADKKNESNFVENYQSINTLEECLRKFKGHKVYIDIWSTSCGYCKEEFAYSSQLEKELQNHNVTMIYLSIDSDGNDQKWLDMIKYYELGGYNIRANSKLIADLRVNFGSFGIPKYLLFDEQGNVINDNAPRPSDLGGLKKLL